jgi:hypothetical protein
VCLDYLHIDYAREFATPARYWDSYSVFYAKFSDVLPQIRFLTDTNTQVKNGQSTNELIVVIPKLWFANSL